MIAVAVRERSALSAYSPLFDSLEAGILLISLDREVLFANQAMAALIGLDLAEIVGMSPEALSEHVQGLVDEPPPAVAERRLFARDLSILCEEFEIVRPSRSVVRWVTRRMHGVPEIGQMIICTDITAEVDLAAAQERLALYDRLTGLMNRRGMTSAIQRETSRAMRAGASMSVALLDIDHFKRINDKHGHDMGDLVLKLVATTISKAIRTSDLVARWGGEEFLLLLPDTNVEGARVVAERVRNAVASLAPPCGTVTISVGIAELTRGEAGKDVLKRADAMLYEAKGSGRNRVC
jgi:diguanylate cyclase (GGDEF)-like protein/PAS domain S-box-containing protein